MELVSKIFETLEISQLALLQLGLVVALAFLLSTLLIKPILPHVRGAGEPLREADRGIPPGSCPRPTKRPRGTTRRSERARPRRSPGSVGSWKRPSRAGRREIEAVVEETNLNVEKLEGPGRRREGIGRRAPALPGVVPLHGDRPESPRRPSHEPPANLRMPRAARRRPLCGILGAPARSRSRRRRAELRKEAASTSPGERSSAGDQLPHPRRGARLFPAQAVHLLSQGAKRSAAQVDRRRGEGPRGGGGEAGRHRDPHRETGRRDRRDEREDGRRGRRRCAAPEGNRRRRDLPDPRPVGVHRRAGSEEGPRGAAPGGRPPFGPRRRGARPEDLVARGSGAAGT